MGEIVEEGRVVEGEGVVHVVEVFEQFLDVAGPEFADEEEGVFAESFFEILHEIVGESLGEVLAGVEAEPFELELSHDPGSPGNDIFDNFGVVVVNVCKHEVVCISIFIANACAPAFVFDSVNASFVSFSIIVCT